MFAIEDNSEAIVTAILMAPSTERLTSISAKADLALAAEATCEFPAVREHMLSVMSTM